MASTIDKETFQRLTLLYLIGQFPNGVFSSFRLQKVLYFATRDVEPKPFSYYHLPVGAFSKDAAVQLLQMLESEILKREVSNGEFGGALWQAGNDLNTEELDAAFELCFPDLANSIAEYVAETGFLSPIELEERMRADPLLTGSPQGCMLLQGYQQNSLVVALDEDMAEDFAMLLSSHFISMMNHLPDLKKAHGVLPAEWAPL